MLFEIQKSKMLYLLNQSLYAVSSVCPLPILSGIYLEVKNDCLTLISSDSNISIKTFFSSNDIKELNIKIEGKCVIDARYFLEIIKKIDGQFIRIENLDSLYYLIKGDKAEYKINTLDVNNYPSINFETHNEYININTQVLTEMINTVSYASSEKDIRPVLTGINFIIKNNLLTITATDSYRLATKTIEINNTNKDLNFTINEKTISKVLKVMENEEEIKININNQNIVFQSLNTIVVTKLLEDIFPDTSKLTNINGYKKIEISKSLLLQTIDRTLFIKDETENKTILKLSITNNQIEVSTYNNISSFKEKIDFISYDGNELIINCSGKYLIDALRNIDSDVLYFYILGENKPIILKSNTNDNSTHLISVIKCQN